MPQDQNWFRTSPEEDELKSSDEDFKEASLIYVIQAFEEQVEEDVMKVWKLLPNRTKARLRNMVALEQLHAEGHL